MVTTHYKPLIGGALTVYDALASHAGEAIEVLTAHTDYVDGSEVEGWQEFDEAASYKIHRIKELRPIRDREPSLRNRVLGKVSAWQLNRIVLEKTLELIDEGGFDTLCIGALDTLGWLGSAVKKQRNIKVTLFIHGEEVSQEAYSARAMERRFASLASVDRIFAVSSFTVGILKARYGISEESIRLQSNGVDLDLFDGTDMSNVRATHKLTDTPLVFACGWLVARKGFDRLIETWPAVLEKVPGAQLKIAGGGPLEEKLSSQIKTLGLDSSVELLGWVNTDNLKKWYGMADIFIMPNRTMPDGDTEGFGLVFLEAAAMRTPSIGGNAGGVVDVIIHEQTGLLIDAEDPVNISEALIQLLTNEEYREKLTIQAYEHAQTQGWQQKTNDFIAELKKLVADN
ncbi:glycosyltransferase family 4 protein [Kordiimonas sp. SCSIO 12603]|uniref:glycosyltransferase family 4 protein n=1 Tax=Kordiimonas sp. SCSIO 12603 TaxID=2829596 RepID=UPI002106AF9A|nr:glycosyltransferase family 4 protein [Kordiimonas sp. SCSIO 12603]UTW57108.1 glycosyltransferase family 4 protein [Kordiimonas sp. SCSIO 12603]